MEENNLKGCKGWILKSYHPVPTINSTLAFFSFIAFLFILLGIIIQVANNKIVEFSMKYSEICQNLNDYCEITLEINEKMDKPIFFFYELDNFYQNHRRYLRSKSLTQLSGENIDLSTAEKNCDPIIKNSDLNIKVSWKNQTLLNQDEIASPCGLMAKSIFNDSFELFSNENSKIAILENEITWPEDIGKKFKRAPNSETTQWIDPENEHFIVWMRPAGLANFRKLWGRIEQDLEPGKYRIKIYNLYNASSFEGSKKIVLSTSGPFGGKNTFLSITFIVVGCVYVLISIIFYMKKKLSQGRFGAYSKEE